MDTAKNYTTIQRGIQIILDRCVESCYTLNDVFNKVCVPNKAEDLNLSVFNMVFGII